MIYSKKKNPSTTLGAGNRNSFTLIELLVVLALVAILSVVVVMTLNPAELLKQARDSNRLSDLATINTALNLFSTDVTSGFMGTSTVVYVSIPDNASSTCGSLGLPTLPTGYTYNCVTAANLRNTDGTGWIPVNFSRISSNSPISQLPIDPQNTTSSLNYYTYVTGGSWKLAATLEAQKNITVANSDSGTSPTQFEMGNDLNLMAGIFPSGWIKVPGNSTFGTFDFWVMKYEAKCADSISSGVGFTTSNTGYNTFSNSSGQCAVGNKIVVSVPTGYPIAEISQSTSKNHCQSIGAHLITNDEWMTISRNIEQVPMNWSSGSVGSGYIFSGHNDGDPMLALQAPQNDTNVYYGTLQSTGSQRRTWLLSNGSVIWDFAGNVSEFVQRSALNIGDIQTVINPMPSCSDGVAAWGYCEYGNTGTYVSSFTADVARDNVGPSNNFWNSAQGVGQIYTYKNGTSQSKTVFRRGGLFNNIGTAGIFSLVLNNDNSELGGTMGFRCAR